MAEIKCDIYQKVYKKSKAGRYDYTIAKCNKCGHKTESNGSGLESIMRCFVLMRNSCPNKENNFYVESKKTINDKQQFSYNFLNKEYRDNNISYPYKVYNDETIKKLIDENDILKIDITSNLGEKLVLEYKNKNRITWSNSSKSRKGYTYFTVSYSFRIYEKRCYIDSKGSYGNYKKDEESRKRREEEEPGIFTIKPLSELLLFLWKYDKYSILNIQFHEKDSMDSIEFK